jgi:predicted transglutaminase-like cysteine proteinase
VIDYRASFTSIASSNADLTQIHRSASLRRSQALIAAFLLICLATLSGGPGAYAYASAAAVAIATTHNESQYSAKTSEKVADLDPEEPSIKSPVLRAPFSLNTVPIAATELLTKWTNVEADMRAESDILARCRDIAEPCPSAAQKFLAIIAEGLARTRRADIGVINRAIRPMSDLAQWREPDRWSAPLDTIMTGRGDCEDYAIAKYVVLRAAGIR